MLGEPLVWIIVLNWNGWQDTIELLTSLRSITYRNHRTVVFDNGSTDLSVSRIRDYANSNDMRCREILLASASELAVSPPGSVDSQVSQELILMRSQSNLGFAAANNIVIRSAIKSGAEYVLLLNNDMLVHKDFLGHLVETGSREERVGIVGGKIYYYYKPTKVWFAGGRISLIRAGSPHFHEDQRGEKAVGFVTGSAMLVKTAVFRNIGLLDEQYFFSAEDVDLCYRASRAGWKIMVNLDALLWHKVGATSGGRRGVNAVYFDARYRIQFAKSLPVPWRLFSIAYILLTRLMWLTFWVATRHGRLALALLKGTRDGLLAQSQAAK